MLTERVLAAVPLPEHQILLMLARTRISEAGYAEVRQFIANHPIDWRVVVDTARAHGVLALSYRHLLALRPESLPKDLIQISKGAVMSSAARNLQMAKEVIRIAQQMNALGIEVLTYKGAALALLAFDGVGGRQFNDIDLLVSSADLVQAKNLLLEQQYVAVSSPEHRSMQKDDHDRSYQGYDLVSRDGRIAVDLQERFGLRFSSFDLSFSELWARRQTIGLPDSSVMTLSFEDYILVLSAHGTQHRWGRLKWVSDLAELVVRASDLNWDTIIERAKVMRTERMVRIGLLLAHEAMGMPLTAEIERWVYSDSAALKVMQDVLRWMFIEASNFDPSLQRALFDYGFDLSVRPRLNDKVQCVIFLTRRRLMRRVRHEAADHPTA
ncbi:MAG: nucleotidyltransferase family protein [Anaerolineae bacterium]|nr:nucleotidyltransferase family protein [Anaerolineae bacterium]NUQ06067.1 nucleotidyltransferase family protein [Anaerolineae bacterium]